MKVVGYSTACFSVCEDGTRCWNMFRFHVSCTHFRGAFFVHLGSAQLCTENGVPFHMCSAVEVALLAQKIRHISARL